jgi:peptide-methionine (S)-S-oxide reductase
MDERTKQDAAFQAAVAAMDAGDIECLERIVAARPALVHERLESPGPWLREKVGGALDGFFQRPFLLWFIAEDPVRNGRVPSNIAAVTTVLLGLARRYGAPNLQEQLDAALNLVSWSWIARECGVQIALIDVLVDAGADLDGNPSNALVNGNEAAADHLVKRGAPLTLATAVCLERWSQAEPLLEAASGPERRLAMVLAALNGKSAALRYLVRGGLDVNSPSESLYAHGTPLHHAVASGSLDAVQVLVEAGADVNAKDSAWDGTPLGWAEHYVGESAGSGRRKQYAEIAAYLAARSQP